MAEALDGVVLADPAEVLFATLFFGATFFAGFLLVIFLEVVDFLGAFLVTLLVTVYLAIKLVKGLVSKFEDQLSLSKSFVNDITDIQFKFSRCVSHQ